MAQCLGELIETTLVTSDVNLVDTIVMIIFKK